jgi:acyl carrier protein
MNKLDLMNKIQEIFRDVFDEEDLNIVTSTNSDDIDEWDSLNHINLVSSIEKDLGIRFSLGELESLKDVGAMADLIIEKLG